MVDNLEEGRERERGRERGEEREMAEQQQHFDNTPMTFFFAEQCFGQYGRSHDLSCDMKLYGRL